VKTNQYLFSFLILVLIIVVGRLAWSESTSMIVKATVIGSCRLSMMHELTSVGPMRSGEWFGPTPVGTSVRSCQTVLFPQIVVDPKPYRPMINLDSINGPLQQSGYAIHTDVIFTTKPGGVGAKAAHRVLRVPLNPEVKSISNTGSSPESKRANGEPEALQITIHY